MHDEIAIDAAAKPPGQLPPLRVHHILLWMAVTAAFLAGARLAARPLGEMESLGDAPLAAVGAVVYSILVAGCVVIALLAWRRRQLGAFDEPGQRLAFDVAIRSVLIALVPLIAALIGAAVVIAIAVGVSAIITLQFVFADSLPSPWQYVFYLKAAQLGGAAVMVLAGQDQNVDLMNFVPLFLVATYIILIVLQLVGIYVDRLQKRPRQWSHWFGLLAHVGLNLLIAVAIIVFFASLQWAW
jgi:hypothetical protein